MKALITIILLPFRILAFILGTGWRIIATVVGVMVRMFRFVFTHSIGATIGAVVGFVVGRKLMEREPGNSSPPPKE